MPPLCAHSRGPWKSVLQCVRLIQMEIPRLSQKEFVVLELLVSKGEMYGLEMVKAAGELKRGTVYVLLNRMADKGYVESRQVKGQGAAGLPRRLYKATGHGARVLHAWTTVRTAFAEGSI